MKRSTRPPVVTAPEWRSLLKRGTVAGVSRAGVIKREGESVSFIASTLTADRYGDTIDQTGWVTDAFEKNPVLLWAHSHVTPPVGKVGKLDKSGDLVAKDCVFTNDEEHPFGAQVGRMVKGGFLNAVSVGFLPLEWEERHGEDGRFLGYHFKKMELLEISVVPVPANPQALATGKAFTKSLAEWCDAADESSPMARQYQGVVRGFLTAAEELQTRAEEGADADAFADMLKLLERIAVATERNTAELKSLQKAMTRSTELVTELVTEPAPEPAPEEPKDTEPAAPSACEACGAEPGTNIDCQSCATAKSIWDFFEKDQEGAPLVPEPPVGEDAHESITGALLSTGEG